MSDSAIADPQDQSVTKEPDTTAACDTPPADPPVHRVKAFSADVDVKEGERAVIATISTITPDRDHEVMLPKGANLKDYRKDPVVLWSHDTSIPTIAKCQWVKSTDDGLIAKAIFDTREFAEEIFGLYQRGFLKAFSVGFDARNADYGPPEEKELRDNPQWASVRAVVRKWTLLEFSAVNVPANPEALAHAVSKGMKMSPEMATALGVDLTVPPKVIVSVPRTVKRPRRVKAGRRPTIVLPYRKPITVADVQRVVQDTLNRVTGKVA